jgi:DNA invertase Pin-like site-specific DNA recombinase
MGKFFAYARVSTPRQGERGVSLPEQKSAIEKYASVHGLMITRWFEERESASQKGRSAFTEMLRLLRLRNAHGVIIHKIDRSARNLEDWADVGKLVDAGVEVHFATENVDLRTVAGRLSADIQAVVAAHYSRNLREEVKKGLYGRLKQGFYPWRAPLGYLDQGSAKAKIPDPVRAPLIQEAFTLYASGRFSLPRLAMEMFCRGLRNRNGGNVTINGLATILKNPFYVGLIRIFKTGQTFEGTHEPLVTTEIFRKVQEVLAGKRADRSEHHVFPYSRFVRCATCGYSLIAERSKGHVYYRCHNRPFKNPPVCPPTSIREETLDAAVLAVIADIDLSDEEVKLAHIMIADHKRELEQTQAAALQALRLQHDQVRLRLTKLTDLLVDGTIDKSVFGERRGVLLLEQARIKERLAEIERNPATALAALEKTVELAKSPSVLYKSASLERKRELLKTLLSNLTLSGKKIEITLALPFRLIAERQEISDGRAAGSRTRKPMKITKSFYIWIWIVSAPERTRIVVSGKIAHLSLPARARYLALHEPDRARFAGILPYLARGVSRRDFLERSTAVRLRSCGALSRPCAVAAGGASVERRTTMRSRP